ncbi:MAG: phosphatase PAP2 family protein [Panacagrimonas sp.]
MEQPSSRETILSGRGPSSETAVVGSQRVGQDCFKKLALELALYLGMVATYAGSALLVAEYAQLDNAIAFRLYSHGLFVMLSATAVCMLVGYLLHVLIVRRPDYPLRYVRDDLRSHLHLRERLLLGIPLMLLLSIFMSAFSSWKVMIPDLQPFSWDASFAEWDRVLHGGTAPWQWLHPVLGQPWISSSINFVYNAWLLLLYFVLIWQAFTIRNRTLRMQFYISFFLSWSLLGSVTATALSSAGPCYFEYLTQGENPFAPLMAYLRQSSAQVPLWSLDVQQELWLSYSNRALEIGRGISAMPSMHVSSALLMTLVAWRVHRGLGWAFCIFLIVILLGSIHLGWHYAIDGYVSLIATVALWKLAGLVVRHRLFRGSGPEEA